ncbi:MAG: hypothetical protein HYU54_08660 [Actinobacteria bacterium]|nr:hypothetical protein [Actinomycetota bacterium]
MAFPRSLLSRLRWRRGSEPTQASLDGILEGAARIRLREVMGGRELLDLRDREAIGELRARLRIRPGERFHCMCPGDQAIDVFDERTRRATITLHHGRSLRWDGWSSDVLLGDPGPLLEWLAGKGAPGPLREWELDRDRAERDARAHDGWRRAAPPCLAPLLPELASGMFNPEVPAEPIRRGDESLRGAYATEAEAILALLAWFGHGAGPWNGFPSYEGAAESLLLLHPTERIVEALRSAELTPAHLEGAARLFASWWFAHMRPADIDLVPGELKRRLMEHVEASGDGDKMERLRRALRGGRV